MLTGVKWLKNRGVMVTRTDRRNRKKFHRFVRPNGELTVLEAARALKTSDMKLIRLAAAGLLKTRRVSGVRMVPLHEVKRLRATRGARIDRRRSVA